jgi:hypothetical protein
MKTKHRIAALLALLLLLPLAALAAPVGKITNMVGNVDITAAGTPARNALPGDSVNVGDFIRTKSKSKVEITFTEGNILRLAENTRVGITEYMSGEKQNSSIFNLFRGKIQNIVKAVGIGGGRYEVHTPTSVCGVRGTHFFNFYLAGASGSIFQEGSGYGYSKNNPNDVKTINANQGMYVAGANLGAQLRSVSGNQLDEMKNATEISGSSGSSGGSGFSVGTGDTPPPPPTTANNGQIVIPPTPITEQILEPTPEPPPPPVSGALSATMDNSSITAFGNLIENGTLTGTSTDGGATYNLTAAGGVTGTPDEPAGTTVSGTLGAGQAFSGYLMGLPGSWTAIMSSIYVTGTEAGFLVGPLAGDFSGNTFSGSGVAVKGPPVASTNIDPNNLVLIPWFDIGLPVFGDIVISGGVTYFNSESSPSLLSEARGIVVTGGEIGVGGAYSIGGVFYNPDGATGFSGQQYFKYDAEYARAFLSTNLQGVIDPANRHVSLAGDFLYMDTFYKGVMSMNHFGVFSPPVEGISSYNSIAGYTIQLAPLTFANELNQDSEEVEGILGATQSIWTNSAIPFYAIGRFTDLGGNFYIMSGNWQSVNYFNSESYLTNDGGGAYSGYLNHSVNILGSSNTVTTDALALYVAADGSGDIGILRGSGSGELSLYTSAFAMEGTLTRVLMDTGSEVIADTFGPSDVVSTTSYIQPWLCEGYCYYYPDLMGGPLSLELAEFGSTTISTGSKINGISTWGIEKRNMGGTYSGSSPTGDFAFSYEIRDNPGASTAPFGESTGSESFVARQTAGYYDVDNGGFFRSSIAGATADWINAATYVFGGTINGRFSPAGGEGPGAWDAIALTSSIETAVFIAMASTDAGRAKLAALNIPSVQVGTVTLSSGITDANWSSTSPLSINNIGFYASTAGGKPQIWASNNISGTAISVAPTLNMPSILTGGGLQADFTVRRWDSGKWAADIKNGIGGFNGTNAFQGGAAGTYSGSSISAGTASGTAHTVAP